MDKKQFYKLTDYIVKEFPSEDIFLICPGDEGIYNFSTITPIDIAINISKIVSYIINKHFDDLAEKGKFDQIEKEKKLLENMPGIKVENKIDPLLN